MWDNPRLLNAAASLLAGLAAALLAFGALQLLLRSPLFPVKEIVLQGPLKNAARGDIEAALAGLGGNFFAVDLAAMRARLEQVPWVRRVDVRRVWPDRIEASIEEHVAFARWGDDALVNTFGEKFPGKSNEPLPVFAGPPGSEAELARRYRRFTELLAPLGEAPARVLLTARHAWQLRLAGGLTLELGRDGAEAVEQRLARFVAAYPETLGRLGRHEGSRFQHVDLRYPNGFALRVAGGSG
ncbi:MAG: FtsQ-type POTRA domain-containing protein [Betaproteobacteria bacterium]|nr:FtsQ-type POTRA domain-containing protein [Betaproteobacteria bacterium]